MLSLHKKFIINERGVKTAAILPYSEWQRIMAILEEYEDIRAYDKAKSRPSHPVSFEKAIKKLKSKRK